MGELSRASFASSASSDREAPLSPEEFSREFLSGLVLIVDKEGLLYARSITLSEILRIMTLDARRRRNYFTIFRGSRPRDLILSKVFSLGQNQAGWKNSLAKRRERNAH